jgi:hypothetical protein
VAAVRNQGLSSMIADFEIERFDMQTLAVVNLKKNQAIIAFKGSKQWDEVFDMLTKASPFIKEAALEKESFNTHGLPDRFNQALIFTNKILSEYSCY